MLLILGCSISLLNVREAVPATVSRTTVRTCASKVDGGYSGMKEIPLPQRQISVRIGAVLLVGAREYASLPGSAFALVAGSTDRFPVGKILVLVRARSCVTLSVAASARSRAALLYDPLFMVPPTGVRIDEGAVRVIFRSCMSGYWTEFNGGVVVAGAGCVPLRVKTAHDTRSGTLSFGAGHCTGSPGNS
jgi:hypothetical protein